MHREFVPCLLCDPEMRFEPALEFLNHFHLGPAHGPGEPQSLDDYKAWVAEEYDLDPDHPVLHESGALTLPNEFERYRHLFER